MLHFSDLPRITAGKIMEQCDNWPIEYLLTDSRKIISPVYSLFFAIKGERHDGHKFIEEAYTAGVRQFVVEKYSPKLGVFTDANFFEVNSSLKALQEIAAHKRKGIQIPVIGITGSNAKTIVKEWLAQLLMPDQLIVKSPKSYNSQVGVPLSVWQMNERHTLGIFEAGISKPGEMELLEKIIQPTIGVFTNVGSAHDEGFSGREQKIKEKLKLFTHTKTLFYCKDHSLIHNEVQKTTLKTFTWSMESPADLEVRLLQQSNHRSTYSFRYQPNENYIGFTLDVPFADTASIENIMHCVAVMAWLGIAPDEMQKRVIALKKVSMRLEMKQGINNCYIIDDTYNNDLAGLTIALDFLQQQHQKPNKTLILSDLYETGLDDANLYEGIAAILKEKGISRFIGIGHQVSFYKKFFPENSSFYLSTTNFLGSLRSQRFMNEIVLVKGSRVFEFEKIVAQLQQKAHRTMLEINLDALSHNLNFYRSRLQAETKLMVMVKSFAYGSGSLEVAQLLQFHRVDYLAVAYPDEGVMLRDHGITLPIMVMNPSEDTYELLLKHDLEPVVYALPELESLVGFLEENAAFMKVHVEIETGMHRLGIENDKMAAAIELIKKCERISIASVFSHLAGADDEIFSDYTHGQYAQLCQAAAFIENQLKVKPLKHLLNSAGIVRYPDYQLDMVRLGIGLYGVEANGMLQSNLEPVGTLKTTISQIKQLKAGETVGYSRKGKTSRDTTIGIIAIGYGDGYSRSFSNGVGKVWINGQLAPVIGNVCMDMTMIDLTDIEAETGDEVIVFGKQLSIIELAKSIGTIPYEILTSVSERVKRVFFSE